MTTRIRRENAAELSLESIRDMIALLRMRAMSQPNDAAYVFLADGERESARLSFGDLDRRARAIAANLQKLDAKGERALLLYPPGLDYIEAFFGCLYAGAIAVPAYPPSGHHLERLQAICADARPAVGLTLAKAHERFKDEALKALDANIRWLITDQVDLDEADWSPTTAQPEDLAFLQYTSGSTGDPRGVMVSHGNLIANQALIKASFRHTATSTLVGWLPFYHDMGLIGNILQPLYVGAAAVLMSPTAFLEKPIRWLKAISDYGAHTSGGPNFAFDLCAKKITSDEKRNLDLSCWKIAFSGAEPVRAATLDRFIAAFADCGFQRDSFFPCYGLAEATLVVTAPSLRGAPPLRHQSLDSIDRAQSSDSAGDQSAPHVGCGCSWPEHDVVIVDPQTRVACDDGRIGEIWIAGPNVAQGYWEREAATRETFHARLVGSQKRFLRTGDLGFLDRAELFVTGRLKDLIIIRGRNYYPQDFEHVIDDTIEEAREGCCAAFAVTRSEQESFVMVIELRRDRIQDIEKSGTRELLAKIRSRIAQAGDVAPADIVLVRPGSVPKTSSGKLRRAECRRRYLHDELPVIAREAIEPPTLNPATSQTRDLAGAGLLRDAFARLDPEQKTAFLTRYLISVAAKLLGIEESALRPDASLTRNGLDSLRALEIQHALEQLLGRDVPLAPLLSDSSLAEAAETIWRGVPKGGVEALDTRDAAGARALSHTERAIWSVHRLDPSGVAYNLHLALQIDGPLNAAALEKSLTDVIERHSALRSAYVQDEKRILQSVRPAPTSGAYFSMVDATSWTARDLQENMGLRISEPFDLASGLLFNARLYRRAATQSILLLCAHHIAIDLWSLMILLKELEIAYRARAGGQTPSYAAPPEDYGHFVAWQRSYLQSESGEAAWTYWRDRLSGALPVLELPTDHPRRPDASSQGSAVELILPAETTAALRGLASDSQATLFAVLLAAYKITLHRFANQTDLIVGAASSGRSHGRFAKTVGNFVNPIALRTQISPQMRFCDFLHDVQLRVREALIHQSFPFSEIVERLKPERNAGRWPIFQTWFSLQQAQSDTEREHAQFALGEASERIDWADLAISGVRIEQRIERFDLKLMAAERQDGLALSFQYRSDLFRPGTIERFARGFDAVIAQILAHPQAKMATILTSHAGTSTSRRNELEAPEGEWKSIPDLVSYWAQKAPDVSAVVCGDAHLTFAELQCASSHYARRLRREGVGPDAIVGVIAERSVDSIIAIIAIMKAGGAYLPLDPDLPTARIATIAAVAEVRQVLCRREYAHRSFDAPFEFLEIDTNPSPSSDDSSDLDGVGPHPRNLAYVVFTSGSTGEPKGVAVSHASLINYTHAILHRIGEQSGMRFALVSTLAADLGHTVTFSALASGGCLHLLDAQAATDPRAFADYLNDNAIDVLKIVPSHYNALMPPAEHGTPAPRHMLIFGGEAFPPQLAARIATSGAACRMINHYGPTETTVGALVFPLTSADFGAAVSVPVGRPIDNVDAYVVDRNYDLAPEGVEGEICLAGAGLARGYIGRPDLTAERFIPNPFDPRGARMYRTGDLARLDHDGNIVFVGRIDQQIKIRGYRVEPAEVQARLAEHPDVVDCIVLSQRDAASKTAILAYFIPAVGRTPEAGALREYLAALLPDYMIPSAFMALSAFPLTANGKLDRDRLPKPTLTKVDYRAPRNAIEQLLAKIYADVLDVEDVGVDDNFFSIGGDSISSIQVASRAYAAGLTFNPSAIFRHQCIAELASELTSARIERLDGAPSATREAEAAPSADASGVVDSYPLTPLQEGLLFHTLAQPSSGVYVMQHKYWIEGVVDPELFRRAWQAIVDAHPIFRTSFAWEDRDRPLQVVQGAVELSFGYFDWRSIGAGEQDQRLDELLATERQSGFDLSAAPPVRIRLIRLGERCYLLIRSHHHILFDAWCTSAILKELQSNYEKLTSGRPLLSSNCYGFRDYIDWLRRQDGDAAERFWRRELDGFDEPTPLFTGHSTNVADVGEGEIEDLVVHLSEDMTAALKDVSQRLCVTPNSFAQAALAVLLTRYTNRSDVLFGVTVSGRPATLSGVESILGLFINALPLRVGVDLASRVDTLLQQIIEKNYAMRDFEYVGLTQLQEWCGVPRGTELFQYLLTFENAPVDASLLESRGSWRFTDCWHRTHTNYPVTFVVIPGQRLHLQITYARARLDHATAKRFLAHYRRLLVQMIERPDARLIDLVMMSEDEHALLVDSWNQTTHRYAEPRDIIGRFRQQVAARPDAIAAGCDSSVVTYRELSSRVERVANALVASGVKTDDIIVLLDERGIDFLVAMLGVFMAGGGYLPLDPAHPDARIMQTLEEARAPWMLAGSAHCERAKALLAGVETRTVLLDFTELERGAFAELPFERRYGPANIAFVIYTSGSTGTPKGAVVEHRGMFNNLITKQPALELTSRDVVAQTASQCFDISVWQLLTGIAVGARVEIFRDEISRDPQRLLPALEGSGVTILEAVPSMIRALLDAADAGFRLDKLRWLLPCGEAFAPELCRSFMERFPHIRLLNAYGPAECSDDVSYHPITSAPEGDEPSVPIGRPVDNTKLYIFDRWLDPAPIGVAGEICVAGEQVGRGYLNRADLTAAAFVPHPFERQGSRLYRTGDLGRYRADGVIDFLGRVDHQIKIRGNRIEPGDIQACLLTHPNIREACVVAREASKSLYRLVAYLVGDACDVSALRDHVLRKLPDYMLPSAFVFMERLPLTSNGKIDRKRLPELGDVVSLNLSYRPPSNATEVLLCGIWSDVLKIDRVGVDDNFFELGGHSLLAIQVRSRIHAAFDVDLPLRVVFETTTISALAERVEDALLSIIEATTDEEADELHRKLAE